MLLKKSLKYKIVFTMIIGVITTGIISFTLISVNIGFTDIFMKIWLKSWGLAYLVVIPVILITGPLVEKLVDKILKNNID